MPEYVGYSGEALVKEFDRREQNTRLWKPTWQDVSDYILPRKGNINRTLTPGQQNMAQVVDGTAIQSNELLAASMQGSLTPSSMPWFRYRIKGLELRPGADEDRWLEDAARITYEFLRYSNFNSESHEFYQDLSAFGTGNIFVEEMPHGPRGQFTGIRFRSIDIGSYLIEENFEGRVVGVWRKFELPAGLAVKVFEQRISQKVKEVAKQEPERRFPFLHVVRPREAGKQGYGAGPLSRPFGSWYVDYEHKDIVDETGYHEFPFMVTRWSKALGEEWGRGPGMTALPDTKTLNKLVELKLALLGKIVNPPLKVRDEGVVGVVRLTPGGLTHVRDMDAVMPLDMGGRGLQAAEMEEDKLRMQIRRYFFSDQLQLQEGPQMTATEVQVRYELMQRILGPTLGRVEGEFQNPMLERVFHILLRAGQFRPMPALIQRMYREGRLDIEYEGPLARAQRLQESLALQRFYAIAAPLAAADPSVMDVVDNGEAMRIHAESLGVPSRAIRSPEQVAEIRAARLQAQQEAQAAQVETLQAEALGKLAPFIRATQESAAGTMGVPPTLVGRT